MLDGQRLFAAMTSKSAPRGNSEKIPASVLVRCKLIEWNFLPLLASLLRMEKKQTQAASRLGRFYMD